MPPSDKACTECITHGPCVAVEHHDGPFCPKYPRKPFRRTCGECYHLAPGRYTDPTPELSTNTVYGCMKMEPFMGVHAHTGACLKFEEGHR
jgi:hypothetical protein